MRYDLIQGVKEALSGVDPFGDRVELNRTRSFPEGKLPAIKIMLTREATERIKFSKNQTQRMTEFSIRIFENGADNDQRLDQHIDLVEELLDGGTVLALGDNFLRMDIEYIEFQFDEDSRMAYAEMFYTATWIKT